MNAPVLYTVSLPLTRYILEWYFLHYLPTYYITYTQCTHSWLLQYPLAEIKPCGLGSRIWYVEAFWYKTEFKIIYFVKLCLIVLIVFDCLPWIYFLSTYNKFRVRVNHPVKFASSFELVCGILFSTFWHLMVKFGCIKWF